MSGHEIRQLIGALRRARARQVPASQSLNALRDAVHANAREKGFWDEQRVVLRTSEDAARCGVSGAVTTTELDHAAVLKTIPEKLMLIVTEVAEAMEDYREHDCTEELTELLLDGQQYPEPPGGYKPLGFVSELADVLIRVFDLAGPLGIDLDEAVRVKMKSEHNATRSHKHGKVC